MSHSESKWNQINSDNKERDSNSLGDISPSGLILNLGSQHEKDFKTLTLLFIFESPGIEKWLEK